MTARAFTSAALAVVLLAVIGLAMAVAGVGGDPSRHGDISGHAAASDEHGIGHGHAGGATATNEYDYLAEMVSHHEEAIAAAAEAANPGKAARAAQAAATESATDDGTDDPPSPGAPPPQ